MTRFPRLQQYIDSLPDGVRSYPQCQGKASMFRIALELYPVREVPEGLPEHVRPLLSLNLPPNQWVPEVDYVLFSIAMAEIHDWDNAGMRQYWFRVMQAINNSTMYGGLFKFLSPRMLVSAVASRWPSFHLGTTCSAVRQDGGLLVTLRFPRGLFPSLIAHGYAGVFDALAQHSRFFQGSVELVAHDEEKAQYLLRDLAPT